MTGPLRARICALSPAATGEAPGSDVQAAAAARMGAEVHVIEAGAGDEAVGAGGSPQEPVATSDEAAIGQADVLLLDLAPPMAAVLRAAAMARASGVAVILNASPAPTEALPDDLLACVDILIVNEEEARAVARSSGAISFAPTRPPDADQAAEEDAARALHPALAPLIDLGPGLLILTLGQEGAAFSWEREAGRAPGFAAKVVDRAGAGGAFCGAFACRWGELRASGQFLDRMSVVDALSWACAAGALATLKPGALPSLPTRAETLALLKSS